ncbi:hypothetical protein EMIHUDRAFT_215218 [Emiliania huxleyi CCMP1516]|uniref:FAD-binding FR-type domain-containing protein n=2 Tax=Emiliania huxleyi TaxID=2903 RepID=A0A0D3II34_EMIH1|nr:hypothetical protein EMIHUDRAFT_215218 [Emiliania huxleyi CCMP1516]EOD10919.1 hypothetical protein EMIHUDRAFT_215218 [Emiliania huxleyi CCMP1516]|eukprot:XP_005763348.1 hypothetical protein EMIHUDRAFT_215218 [Emiliania huxleyi CCMP1516]
MPRSASDPLLAVPPPPTSASSSIDQESPASDRQRAIRTAIALLAVAASYVLASTYSSPQVLQANRPPHSFTAPTVEGGGYCYTPPCNPFSGTFKSPLFRNPTAVVGTPPDMKRVVAFHGYLAALLGGSLLLQASPRLRAASSASVCLYRLWRGSFGAILFLLLSGSLLGWWAVDAAQLGKLKPWAHSTAVDNLKQLGSAAGHSLNLVLGLSLLPIGKRSSPRSSLSAAFGLSWESALAYHRWLGGLGLGLMLVHVSLELAAWAFDGALVTNLLHYAPTHADTDINAWVIPLMEAVGAASLLAGAAALPAVRRRSYYTFYRLHLLLPLLLVATLVHSWDFWQTAMVGLWLYLLDKAELASLLALDLSGSRRCTLEACRPVGDDFVALALRFPRGAASARPGQVVYVQVPSLSWLQFHPFTVSDRGAKVGERASLSGGGTAHSPADAAVRHLSIKAGRKGSWTRGLHSLAASRLAEGGGQEGGAAPLRVRAIGPFGEPEERAAAHPQLILVAGGVGITPLSALAGAFIARAAAEPGSRPPTTSLRLVWVARDVRLFVEYALLLEELIALPRTSVRLYLTGKAQEERPLPACVGDNVTLGRPDLARLLPSLLGEMRREAGGGAQAANDSNADCTTGGVLADALGGDNGEPSCRGLGGEPRSRLGVFNGEDAFENGSQAGNGEDAFENGSQAGSCEERTDLSSFLREFRAACFLLAPLSMMKQEPAQWPGDYNEALRRGRERKYGSTGSGSGNEADVTLGASGNGVSSSPADSNEAASSHMDRRGVEA